MPDLEQKIQRWRKQMLSGGIKTPAPLDELEAHLRDEIQSQVKQGTSDAEAFAAAVQKMGGAPLLRAEFEKVIEAGKREARELLALVMLTGVGLFAATCALFRIGTCSQMTTTQQIAALTAVLLAVAFGLAGRWGRAAFPIIHSQQMRRVAASAAVILVAIWESVFFFVILQRGVFDMGELITTFYWAFFVPIGFALGLVMGIENAARQSPTAGNS